jgi:hypothetical protein
VLLLCAQDAMADDYFITTHPKAWKFDAKRLSAFELPADPKVCPIYEKNLEYFARRNLAMSCGQPIAPNLRGVIQPMEWEILNPRDLIARPPGGYENYVAMATKDIFVGRPEGGESDSTSPPVSFRLLLIGPGDGNPDDPNSNCRCNAVVTNGNGHCSELKGRKSPSVARWIDIVSTDLKTRFARLEDASAASGQNMVKIHNVPYVEAYDPNGMVVLKEIRASYPVSLAPVCSFEFKATKLTEKK